MVILESLFVRGYALFGLDLSGRRLSVLKGARKNKTRPSDRQPSMAETSSKVSIVVDSDFGSRLESLVHGPVWIIDSPANRMAAEASWQQKAVVTTFKGVDGDSPGASCLKILTTVDLHHGEFSGGYSVLEVIGTPLTEELHAAIKDLGFSKFEATGDGFRASRFREDGTAGPG